MAKDALNNALAIYGKGASKERAKAEHELGVVYLNQSRDNGLEHKKISNLTIAEKHLLKALFLKKTIDEKQSGKDTKLEIALTLHKLGRLYLEKKELDKAERFFQEALLIKQENGAEKKELIVTKCQLGMLHYERNELTQAKEIIEEAINLTKNLYKVTLHSDIAEYLFGLGKVLLKQGKIKEAEEKIKQASDIDSKIFPDIQNFRRKQKAKLLKEIKEKMNR
jgi:tetratricopeptide (TPR) repeat protein